MGRGGGGRGESSSSGSLGAIKVYDVGMDRVSSVLESARKKRVR